MNRPPVKLTAKQGARFLKGQRTEATLRVTVTLEGVNTRQVRGTAKLDPERARALYQYLVTQMQAHVWDVPRGTGPETLVES